MHPQGPVPPFAEDWRQRLRAELYCFYLIFRFHERNNHLRKAVTLMVVFVWAVIELGIAFNIGTPPESLSWLRLFVGVLIARMWNIELRSFGTQFTTQSDQSTDNDE